MRLYALTDGASTEHVNPQAVEKPDTDVASVPLLNTDGYEFLLKREAEVRESKDSDCRDGF